MSHCAQNAYLPGLAGMLVAVRVSKLCFMALKRLSLAARTIGVGAVWVVIRLRIVLHQIRRRAPAVLARRTAEVQVIEPGGPVFGHGRPSSGPRQCRKRGQSGTPTGRKKARIAAGLKGCLF